MSTYLKIDADLPAGLNYLNINDITLPKSIEKIGNITNAFNFASSTEDLVGNSVIVGTPIKKSEGYELGEENYINTNLVESQEFLWISLFKVPSGLSTYTTAKFTSLITSWVRETISGTGFAVGDNLSVDVSSAKTVDNSSSNYETFLADLSDSDAGKWAVALMTRINNGSGYTLNFVFKTKGKAVVQKTLSGSASRSLNLGVYVGGSPKFDGGITGKKVIRIASIHNKGFTQTQLNTIANEIIAELQVSGFDLS